MFVIHRVLVTVPVQRADPRVWSQLLPIRRDLAGGNICGWN